MRWCGYDTLERNKVMTKMKLLWSQSDQNFAASLMGAARNPSSDSFLRHSPDSALLPDCAATTKSLVRHNPVGLQAVFGLIRFSVDDPKPSAHSTNEESTVPA